MPFSPSELLVLLARPGSLLFWSLLLAVVLSWFGATRRLGRGLGVGAVALVLILGTLPLADWLVRPLEEYYPIPALPPNVDGIIVLGGAENPEIMAVRSQPELNSNADRLVAFVALARQYPGAQLVFSGGAAVPHPDGAVTEADVAREVFRLLGLDAGRVRFETESRNTIENARNAFAIVAPRPGQVWMLVTSARHMPRAVNCFDAVGWPVLPYPVDFSTGEPVTGFGFAPLQVLSSLNGLTKEWLGLIGYWVLGHTKTILPARARL